MKVQQIGLYMHHRHEVNHILKIRLCAKDQECENVMFKKAQDKHRITHEK